MKKLAFIFLFLSSITTFAQQVEIAVSSRVEVNTLTDKEIEKFESEGNLSHFTSRTGIVLKKEREFYRDSKTKLKLVISKLLLD